MRKIYLFLLPIINLKSVYISFCNIFRYPSFFISFFKYRLSSKNEVVSFNDLYPCLADKTSTSQSGKGHYFYQDIWALEKVFQKAPSKHIDVGSRIDGFVGQCSSFCDVEFVDLRPVDLGLSRLKMIEGNILKLPYESNSIESLSSLHVVEHIGLGRYGDDVDPEGSVKAMKELERVLKIGGKLVFGIPIGRERVMFNAHRIHFPETIIFHFSKCKLLEFSVVNDAGEFIKNADVNNYNNSNYSCGLFHFEKVSE